MIAGTLGACTANVRRHELRVLINADTAQLSSCETPPLQNRNRHREGLGSSSKDESGATGRCIAAALMCGSQREIVVYSVCATDDRKRVPLFLPRAERTWPWYVSLRSESNT